MQQNVSGAPHTFPLCLMCCWESEPLAWADMVHFSLFLCDKDLLLHFSGGRSLVCWIWNIWSMWATPPSLVHIKPMGPGMEIESQRSGLLSNYVIYRSLFPLHLLSGMILTDKNLEWFTEQTMASCGILYMFVCLSPCWSKLMNNERIQYYLVWCMVASASFAA